MSNFHEADAAAHVVGLRKHPDTGSLATEIAALGEMAYSDLRLAWRRLYRVHPPKKLSRDLLELGVAWKLQERVLGGLSATTKRQLAELAKTMETKSDLAKARKVSRKPGARVWFAPGAARRMRSWSSRMASCGAVRRGARYR